MLISRRSRIALHGLAFLASRSRSGEPIPLREVLVYLRQYTGDLPLSQGYIARLFSELSRAGVLRPILGRAGGLLLARPAREIRLVEIITALDGLPEEGCCLLSVTTCPFQDRCGVYSVVNESQRRFFDFLHRETLASLTQRMVFEPRRPAHTRNSPPRRRRRSR